MRRTQPPAVTPSPVQTQALQLTDQQLKQQQQALQGVQGTVGQAQGTIAAAQRPLTAITTPDATGQTPLRRALSASLNASTSQAYNNAVRNSRLAGLRAGLQNQPAGTVGAEQQIRAEEASKLGQIPSQVEQQAAPLELQAAGQTGQLAGLQNELAGTELGVARTYTPSTYFNTGASMEAQRQQALNQDYLEQQRRNAALWAGLAKAGLSFIPGQYA